MCIRDRLDVEPIVCEGNTEHLASPFFAHPGEELACRGCPMVAIHDVEVVRAEGGAEDVEVLCFVDHPDRLIEAISRNKRNQRIGSAKDLVESRSNVWVGTVTDRNGRRLDTERFEVPRQMFGATMADLLMAFDTTSVVISRVDQPNDSDLYEVCLLYTSDAADE